jgi:hypothetical protein
LLLSHNYQHCPIGVKRIGRISISVIPNNEERVLNIFLKLGTTQSYTTLGQLSGPCRSEQS